MVKLLKMFGGHEKIEELTEADEISLEGEILEEEIFALIKRSRPKPIGVIQTAKALSADVYDVRDTFKSLVSRGLAIQYSNGRLYAPAYRPDLDIRSRMSLFFDKHSDKWCSALTVSRALDIDYGDARLELEKLVDSGVIVKNSNGAYRVPGNVSDRKYIPVETQEPPTAEKEDPPYHYIVKHSDGLFSFFPAIKLQAEIQDGNIENGDELYMVKVVKRRKAAAKGIVVVDY